MEIKFICDRCGYETTYTESYEFGGKCPHCKIGNLSKSNVSIEVESNAKR